MATRRKFRNKPRTLSRMIDKRRGIRVFSLREQQEREENKKKREALDEKERLEREKEKEEERLQEEEEKRKREEKERKEHEEYLKLKEAFSVEDEGCDAAEEEDEENMLLNFINYIKETKVISIHRTHSQVLCRWSSWKTLLLISS